jgi:tetratricopeptide (TPR) repeat protein
MASSISEAARRRPVGAVALLAAFAVVLAAMPVARAQPSGASDATREAARAKLVEGVDALKRGDHRAALARFEEAYALVPSPKIHYDFGLAYLGLERPADALAAFERFLAEAPDAPPDKREKAASLIPTLRARVAELAAPGERAGVEATPPPDAPPAATIERRADAPAGPAPVPENPDPMRARRITAVSLGAAGVGLLAAGLVFGVLAGRESDALTRDSEKAKPDQPTPFDTGKESRGIMYERLQVIGLAVGAVAAAAGAVLYVTSRRRVVVEPVAGQSVAGAALRLTF